MKLLFKTILSFIILSLLFFSLTSSVSAQTPPSTEGWYMAAANPERTSWVPDEARLTKDNVQWYRPIEAYIGQQVQVIATNDLIFLSTAAGLYAFHYDTGDIAWRYDTSMPLGHSPTIVNGVAYVGGYDRRIHAVDIQTGQRIWVFEEAKAGFSTNPVAANNMVYAGNRDGYFYAVDAQTGTLVWQYPQKDQEPIGSIMYSPAYHNGVIYFADNYNYAYALDAINGTLIWRSEKMPGDGYISGWPVIYKDKVIFSSALSYYRNAGEDNPTKDHWRDNTDLQTPYAGPLGPTFTSSSTNGNWDWVEGTTVMDASRITEYLEEPTSQEQSTDPAGLSRNNHKPWRRTLVVLNQSDGSEFTFDSDNDGYQEYAPLVFSGTEVGNRYPPLVSGIDNVIYFDAKYQADINKQWRSQVVGWKVGTQYLSLAALDHAQDEPIAISGGGSIIYSVLCCARQSRYEDISDPTSKLGLLWGYYTPERLYSLAPGYDIMWGGLDDYSVDHWWGNYGAPKDPQINTNNFNGLNGIYHNHGFQNPIVPYKGWLFTHKRNGLIAFGPGPGQAVNKGIVLKNKVSENLTNLPTKNELQTHLEKEVQKIIQAPHFLRIPYNNAGTLHWRFSHLGRYFENPGETLYTLVRAYPHLSTNLQTQAKTYLKSYFNSFFYPNTYYRVRWAVPDPNTGGYVVGSAPESMPLPPEIETDLINYPSNETYRTTYVGWQWNYHPQNYLYLYYYTQLLPEDIQNAYSVAKKKIEVPPSQRRSALTDARLLMYPYELNAFITGYDGFLKLQILAGQEQADTTLRTKVETELQRLIDLRTNQFSKDTPFDETTAWDDIPRRVINISRNFTLLSPPLADYLNTRIKDKVKEALDDYYYNAPYWFVNHFDSDYMEGQNHHLYTAHSLFQTKALVLKEPYEELVKYLDVPAFERGDLLYINNLVSTIEAPSAGTITPLPTQPPTLTPTPSPTHCTPLGDINCSGKVDILDLSALLSNFGRTGTGITGDINGDGVVNISDLGILLSNFGK